MSGVGRLNGSLLSAYVKTSRCVTLRPRLGSEDGETEEGPFGSEAKGRFSCFLRSGRGKDRLGDGTFHVHRLHGRDFVVPCLGSVA